MTRELEAELEALAARLRASTVAVISAGGRGSGSGVVWATDTIVTNAHVAVSRTVEIETADGRQLSGTVERRDENRDLATIRIADGGLPPVQPRSAALLRPGELLVAFGHPLGVRNVLTTGIAFAGHRSGSDRFVRADLRLAPGNSGGALADSAGRVVGINSMVAGGLALAVPSDDVLRFVNPASAASAERLGVRLAAVDPARPLGRIRGAFAVLAVEPGSRADRAGLIPGDILALRSSAELSALAAATFVDVLRGGAAIRVPLEPAGGVDAAA